MSSQRQSLLCRYRYDPLDRLINQARPNAPVYQRFYCKSRLATEIQGAIQHSIIQHGDLLLAQQQRDGDDISATLLATDLQRSVLHTLEKNHQRQSIAYSPYGHRRAENGLTSLLGFNGERLDPVTGHYLLGNGYRAFNPVLIRFNSPDSLSPFEKGGLNSYAYCMGDPVNQTDPTGHVILGGKIWGWVQENSKLFVGPGKQPINSKINIFSTPKTNGLLTTGDPVSKKRPVAVVDPMQTSSTSSMNAANPSHRSTATNANELSRDVGTPNHSPIEQIIAMAAGPVRIKIDPRIGSMPSPRAPFDPTTRNNQSLASVQTMPILQEVFPIFGGAFAFSAGSTRGSSITSVIRGNT